MLWDNDERGRTTAAGEFLAASEYVRNWNAVSAEVFKHPELRPLLRNDAGARDPRASEAAMASIVARDPAIARSCGMV